MARPEKRASLTKKILLRVSKETWGRIQGEAAKEKLAPSTWARQVLEKHLNHR